MCPDSKTALSSTRMRWLDFIRGIAMLLVIIGHCGIPTPYFSAIYMFHMPLFYAITGYCHKWGGYSTCSFRQMLGKYGKRYLLPYCLFSLIGFLVTAVFPHLYDLDRMDIQTIIRYGFGILLARGNSVFTGYWGAVWFLISCCWITLFSYLSDKMKKPMLTVAMLYLMLLLNHYLQKTVYITTPGWLPFNIGAAFVGYAFYCFGLILKRLLYFTERDETSMVLKAACFSIAIIIGFMVGFTNTSLVAFAENFYGNMAIMLTSAVMIITGLFGITKLFYRYLEKLVPFCFVEWIGRQSLLFLGIHGMTIPVSRLIMSSVTSSWFMISILTILLDSVIIACYRLLVRKLDQRAKPV